MIFLHAVKDSVNPENTSDDSGEEKKYTDKDVDAIVNKRFAKWKTEQEQAVKSAKEEAEKLAKMNAEQKQNYEIEKLQKENEKLKQEAAKVELSRSATGILADKQEIMRKIIQPKQNGMGVFLILVQKR